MHVRLFVYIINYFPTDKLIHLQHEQNSLLYEVVWLFTQGFMAKYYLRTKRSVEILPINRQAYLAVNKSHSHTFATEFRQAVSDGVKRKIVKELLTAAENQCITVTEVL